MESQTEDDEKSIAREMLEEIWNNKFGRVIIIGAGAVCITVVMGQVFKIVGDTARKYRYMKYAIGGKVEGGKS